VIKYRNQFNYQIEENMMKLDLERISEKDIGYLIGLYIGDGYSNYNKKDRHYTVEFYLNSLKDIDIQQNLIVLLKKISLNPYIYKDKRYNVNRIRVRSKKFMNFIKKRSKIFNSLSDEYKIGLISGFIDAEGWVTKGEIMVTQKDKEVLTKFKEICESFDIFRKMWPSYNIKSKGPVWRLRISTKFKYLPHNSYKVKRIYSGVGQDFK
jgi:hypothetical protein